METDENYPYTHSAWHVCMSVCIVFLLPLSSDFQCKGKHLNILLKRYIINYYIEECSTVLICKHFLLLVIYYSD